MIMASFKANNNKRYRVYHCNDEDSRFIINAETGAIILTIDSSLNIRQQGQDEVIANIKGYTGQWVLFIGESKHDTGIEVGDYCWKKLLDAEVVAAKIIIDQYMSGVTYAL